MSFTKRWAAASAVAVASAGIVLLGAGAAHAAGSTPPWEPDVNAKGTITFYDANGNVITSGTNTNNSTAPFAAYAVGSTFPRSGDVQAAMYFANPDPNSATVVWYKELVGNFTKNSAIGSGDPSSIQAAAATPLPVVKDSAADQSLEGFQSDAVQSTAPGYANIVQIRLVSANSANQSNTQIYDTADVLVNPTTHSWTQVYPTPAVSTTTTLSASPSPATVGQTVTLTATVTASSGTPTGTVQFMDGSTAIGSPVAINSSGVATTTTSTLTPATHSLSAVYSPGAGFASSTGTTSEVVGQAATPTSTALTVPATATAGSSVTFTANVSAGSSPVTAGTVSFYDNGSTTPLTGSPVSSGTGSNAGLYSLTLASGLAAGSHSIVAVFTPTSSATYAGSQSAQQTVTVQAVQTGACAQSGSQCTTVSNIETTVPVGTLLISTPYSASNPLNLGTMTLNSGATEFSASAAFQNIVVTDTRSGDLPYTVSAVASPLTDGGTHAGSTINAQNIGLTGLTSVAGSGFAGTVTPTNNPAAATAVAPTATGSAGLGGGSSHTVFAVDHGQGTVTVSGTLTVDAPTSTETGLFTGTITFTVG